MRRRGLLQGEMAAEIGISRPTLANILLGRFGASSVVAERLKTFIMTGTETVGLLRAPEGLE